MDRASVASSRRSASRLQLAPRLFPCLPSSEAGFEAASQCYGCDHRRCLRSGIRKPLFSDSHLLRHERTTCEASGQIRCLQHVRCLLRRKPQILESASAYTQIPVFPCLALW